MDFVFLAFLSELKKWDSVARNNTADGAESRASLKLMMYYLKGFMHGIFGRRLQGSRLEVSDS